MRGVDFVNQFDEFQGTTLRPENLFSDRESQRCVTFRQLGCQQCQEGSSFGRFCKTRQELEVFA